MADGRLLMDRDQLVEDQHTGDTRLVLEPHPRRTHPHRFGGLRPDSDHQFHALGQERPGAVVHHPGKAGVHPGRLLEIQTVAGHQRVGVGGDHHLDGAGGRPRVARGVTRLVGEGVSSLPGHVHRAGDDQGFAQVAVDDIPGRGARLRVRGSQLQDDAIVAVETHLRRRGVLHRHRLGGRRAVAGVVRRRPGDHGGAEGEAAGRVVGNVYPGVHPVGSGGLAEIDRGPGTGGLHGQIPGHGEHRWRGVLHHHLLRAGGRVAGRIHGRPGHRSGAHRVGRRRVAANRDRSIHQVDSRGLSGIHRGLGAGGLHGQIRRHGEHRRRGVLHRHRPRSGRLVAANVGGCPDHRSNT